MKHSIKMAFRIDRSTSERAIERTVHWLDEGLDPIDHIPDGESLESIVRSMASEAVGRRYL